MNYLNQLVFLMLFVLLSTAVTATEKCVIKAGWMERPSYQYADKRKQPQGFDIDYMKAIAKDLSCDIVFKRMPWFRQDKEMVAGRIDFLLGALPSGETPDLIRISDSYRQDPIGFYVNEFDIDSVDGKNIAQLLNSGFKLGIISHDTHSPEVLKLLKRSAYKKKIFPIKSTHALLRNLDRKMIRAIMLHSAEVDYLRSINDPLVKNLKLVPSLSFMKPAHLILGAASPLGPDFVNQVNASIKRLNENGINDKLLKHHVPSHFKILQ